jgi:hypothetical protein
LLCGPQKQKILPPPPPENRELPYKANHGTFEAFVKVILSREFGRGRRQG